MKLVLIFVMFPFICLAQKVEWERTIGGNHSEFLLAALSTADYGFLLAGASLSNKTGDFEKEKKGNIDACLWKIKEDGSKEWQYSLGGDRNDYLQSVCHTNDGGLFLGITSSSNKAFDKTEESRGMEDLWLVKLNAFKQIEWQKTIGGSGNDEVVKVLALRKGGYIVLANSNSNISREKNEKCFGGNDLWVVCLNKEGNIVWQKTYGGEYNDLGIDIIETIDGGILIGAVSNSLISGNKNVKHYGEYDYWLIKIDQQGNELWQKSYGGLGDDKLKQVQEGEKGTYTLFGYSNSDVEKRDRKNPVQDTYFWIITIDENGKKIKEFQYNFSSQNLLSNGMITSEGGLFLGGSSDMGQSFGIDQYQYLGVMVDSENNIKWEKEISSDGTNVLTNIIQTRDGGFVFAGTSDGKKDNFKTVKKGSTDFWIVKLYRNDSKKDKEDKIGIEVFPNPTDQFTNVVINFEYNKGSLQLFDLNGRLLQNRNISYQIEPIDLSNLSQGVYIIWVKTDQGEGSVKVVKK
ncbi:MAG: T9SS type A sorting domain-containing protein [Flavobacteriaceae bacterium]|nr:T9SS type A sorting domain-containing protein [Flavobacteriaceae bacterium]